MWENVWWPGGGGGGRVSATQVAGRWWDLRATPWDTLVEKCPASNPWESYLDPEEEFGI